MQIEADSIVEAARGDISDWDLVMRFLPEGWQTQARELGAMRRAREFTTPECLLRTLLIHLVEGCSLRETSMKARKAGIVDATDVAIFKRLRNSSEWLRWMAAGIMNQWTQILPANLVMSDRRMRAVDATIVCEPGKTGSNWRIHYSVELGALQCDHVEVTSVKEGESFRRFPVQREDVLIADRVYGNRAGVIHVAQAGGDVVVRLTLDNLPLETAQGKPVKILSYLRQLRVGQPEEWPVWIAAGNGERISARLCAIKKSRAAAELSRRKLLRTASKQQRGSVRPQTLEASQYVFVLTTLRSEHLSAALLLELYRGRWQIELVFKRLKSLLGLGCLPKHDPDSAKAWLHGKLLAAFLVEALIHAGESFFPWGYPAAGQQQSLPLA